MVIPIVDSLPVDIELCESSVLFDLLKLLDNVGLIQADAVGNEYPQTHNGTRCVSSHAFVSLSGGSDSDIRPRIG